MGSREVSSCENAELKGFHRRFCNGGEADGGVASGSCGRGGSCCQDGDLVQGSGGCEDGCGRSCYGSSYCCSHGDAEEEGRPTMKEEGVGECMDIFSRSSGFARSDCDEDLESILGLWKGGRFLSGFVFML
ncbi:hypothetical protein KC19_6G124600 [Ceratodon purpureus]|uniref:Uncharacterized protein n=1 Tax=Ceratodon purpureus TaxID=3225 RepID=A0A8T0HIU1_CERPU|nr:hypothetical protein KC19_6G124600 [Ceratodon purpureus]